MALFARLSNSFWSYLSPSKTQTPEAAPKAAPQTLPRYKKPAPLSRRRSLKDVIQHSRSMSPDERVGIWRVRSSSRASSSVLDSKKRKRPITPSTSAAAGRRRKTQKRDDQEMYTPVVEDNSDVEMDEVEDEVDPEEDEEEEVEEVSSGISNIRVTKSPSPKGYVYESEQSEVEDTLIISEQDYEEDAPRRMKIITPTTEHFARGVSTEELRADGWDDDHITLVQEIAMRGLKPLMPEWNHQRFPFMPEALFGEDDEVFIRSVRGNQSHSVKALDKLLGLGAHMRDRLIPNQPEGHRTPEMMVQREMRDYIKWADRDADLDKRKAIPLLTVVLGTKDENAEVIKERARRKLTKLAARYKEAFRVLQSIENSPGSRTSTQLSYPIPTFYAIIASHTLVALTAYRPDDPEPDVKSVAFFDMKDKDYDVWNALALAIVVCHVRNVQLRIADETGLGVRIPGEEEIVSDPDA